MITISDYYIVVVAVVDGNTLGVPTVGNSFGVVVKLTPISRLAWLRLAGRLSQPTAVVHPQAIPTCKKDGRVRNTFPLANNTALQPFKLASETLERPWNWQDHWPSSKTQKVSSCSLAFVIYGGI